MQDALLGQTPEGEGMSRTTVSTECTCSDPAHQMHFALDNFPGEAPELYVSVQLNQRFSFLARCWLALQYVVGKRSRFTGGHWDEGSLSPESAKALRDLLTDYLVATIPTYTTTPGTTLVQP